MAKFDGKHLTGMIGKLVTRKVKNKQIVQRAPVSVKQTKATKKAASIFGQGSILAGTIRRNFEAFINSNYHGDMVNRLNTPIRAVIRQCYNPETDKFNFAEDSFSRLAGFEFNIKSLLSNNLWVTPEMSLNGNILKISIPEAKIPKQLKFPSRANLCELTVVVTLISLQQAKFKHPLFQSIEISKTQDTLAAQEFTFEVPDGCLCVAGLNLGYFSLHNSIKTILNNKDFNPAGLLGAIIVPGEFVLPAPIITPNSVSTIPWFDIYDLNLY
ncbi:MAG: hypothetical protein P0Y49_05535 [Candidatus Pedobacter colombiensis]|uniref:Uncharacterized protein n=1 Tax=Candidatus Pedobacter colombiensis TaxID=3121371 RepID=A0AAJ6B867_9SPHI|nr:hypothetical protein [Pedobacter sp.]WEK20599.1 MAG: hypothetical protein P0Y49_05535 [Pedobacter sp.]